MQRGELVEDPDRVPRRLASRQELGAGRWSSRMRDEILLSIDHDLLALHHRFDHANRELQPLTARTSAALEQIIGGLQAIVEFARQFSPELRPIEHGDRDAMKGGVARLTDHDIDDLYVVRRQPGGDRLAELRAVADHRGREHFDCSELQ